MNETAMKHWYGLKSLFNTEYIFCFYQITLKYLLVIPKRNLPFATQLLAWIMKYTYQYDIHMYYQRDKYFLFKCGENSAVFPETKCELFYVISCNKF